MNFRFQHTLYFKMATGLAICLLVTGLAYTIFASTMLQQINQSSQQYINRDLAKNLVNDRKIVRNGKIDINAMKDTFMQYMTINPSIEIYYLDLQGNILAYSAEPGRVKRNAVSLLPIQQRLSHNSTSQILGDDPRSHDITKPFSVTPIPDINNPQGYLYIVLQSEQLTDALNAQSQNTIIYLGGIILSGSLLVGLLIGLYLFQRISKRISLLKSRVENFINSDFSLQDSRSLIPPTGLLKDEISELEEHIGKMSSHIHQQWSALKQQDSLRRELVANISHDLRTPLASLQGYLETLKIKYTDISDSQKLQYLKTSCKQAKNLQKLIDGLFELAKLDAHEHQPEMEHFPLLELVYDVVAKFEIKAQEKNITIDVCSESENPVVLADLGLIERVLDNLISNAIYYSFENSAIKLMIASPEDGSLTVTVCDNGQGIPEDQHLLVFERFHQAHSPERKDGHAGLGLCIVKKIIELHQQSIWLESKPQHGAQFNFTLAAV